MNQGLPSADAALVCETADCAICGSDRRRPLLDARDWLTGAAGEFHIVRCVDCGHMYLCPRPAASELARLYPADYAPHRAAAAEPAAEGLARRWLRAVPGLRPLVRALLENRSTWIPEPAPGARRALELGCSTGWFLEMLRQRGWEAVGVEPIAAPAAIARQRGFSVHVGTLEAAMFPDGSFQAAFAWMVLEHLADPGETLAELRRVLAPGGWLVFSVPNAGCWERRVFGRYWYALMPPVHFQHYTPRALRRLLEQTGYETLRILPQANLLSVVGSVGIVCKAWLPRKRIGPRLVQLTEDPPTWLNLALAPAAHLLGASRQAGRLTVIARSRG